MPALAPLLSDDVSDDMQLSAAIALGEIGPAAADALSELERLRDDERQRVPVRHAAIDAIARISGEPE